MRGEVRGRNENASPRLSGASARKRDSVVALRRARLLAGGSSAGVAGASKGAVAAVEKLGGAVEVTVVKAAAEA